MKTHRRNKSRYTATPQKPELEITSFSNPEDDDAIALNAVDNFNDENEVDETSLRTISNNTLTAPLSIPSQKDLTVNMVPSNLIYQYDEYRTDGARMGAFFYTFLGAFLGVIINWATSDTQVMSKASIIIELILLIVIVIMGLFTYGFNNRAKNKKTEIDRLTKK